MQNNILNKLNQIVNKNIIFLGTVQNVGFRYQFTIIAKENNLVGWIRNLPDGNVETEVQGEEEKIDFLIQEIRKKPRIEFEIISENYIKINSKLKDFTIIY